MKYFCFIFSLYFLALNLMSCTELHTTTSGSDVLYATELPCHPNDSQTDFCSPFCGCSVCGQVLFATKFPKFSFHLPIVRNFKEKNNFFYSKDWQSEYLKSIFRPPQVG